jgi:peptidoglycan/LPS O-acetylase OafA/YrhL
MESGVGKQQGYLPTLDGWRAVAILAVLIGHATAFVFGPEGAYPDAQWLARSRIGGFGVQIFFGISGFLICSRLLEERTKKGRIFLTGFYIRELTFLSSKQSVEAVSAWLVA